MQDFHTGGSEQNTVVFTQMYIGHVLCMLDESARLKKISMHLQYNRDVTIDQLASPTQRHKVKPDYWLIVMLRQLMNGEEKVSTFEVAMLPISLY